MAPKTMKQWNVQGTNGFDSLVFNQDAPIPELGDKDVLVKIHAVSLNYRDLIIPQGKYPFGTKDGVVPCSDGAGTVEAVGKHVYRFKKGDRVATIFNQAHLGGPITPAAAGSGLGGMVDGTLRQYGAFDEQGLVKVPENLNWLEASTLSCAAVTAWNALYGLESKAVKPGNWVLTEGTGGVSIFALQFAKAAGAKVIATTSSNDKGETLKKLGADHVINYKEDQNWGETAKKLTPNGEGVHHIIEVGGPKTVTQALNAIRMEGVITIIGFLGGMSKDSPSLLDCLQHSCIARGVLVGSQLQFEDMNRAIEANDIHPVVDQKVFTLEEAKDAFQYQWDQKHFGKLTIKVD